MHAHIPNLLWPDRVHPLAIILLLAACSGSAQQVDPTFDPDCNGRIFAIVLQLDGKIVIGGEFTSVGGIPRAHLARLNRDGTLDLTFSAQTDSSVYALAVQSDGKILAGGA